MTHHEEETVQPTSECQWRPSVVRRQSDLAAETQNGIQQTAEMAEELKWLLTTDQRLHHKIYSCSVGHLQTCITKKNNSATLLLEINSATVLLDTRGSDNF